VSDKTRDRSYMGMGMLSGGDAAAGTTIVGGQPGETRRGARQHVPVGLERVLFAAAADPEFRSALFTDREAALAARGFALTASERAVLGNLPEAQLTAMIVRLDVSRENLARREFLRNVAGTVIALAAGTALGSCSGQNAGSQTQGGAPFLGPSQKTPDASTPAEPQPPYVDPGPPAGIRPDIPEVPEPAPPTAGVRPDTPPPSIEIDAPDPQPTRGVRPH
jgi:hypothetical protein